MKGCRIIAVVWALAGLTPAPGLAFEPMSGCFVAEDVCQARPAIRDDANPGGVTTGPGRRYRLLGANKEDATHYQIRIEEADPGDRWVAVDCGRTVASCEPSSEHDSQGSPHGATDNLLAASWQPAFCETHRDKPECRTQTQDRFDASHFALHGLWPQPRGNDYCGVSSELEATDRSGDWHELPRLTLDCDTRAKLETVMPGAQSHLQRHEWIKHGTCYSDTPEEYFAESLQLMAALNASPVRELFAANIGGRVSAEEVEASFDEAFGEGAGERVQMDCDDGLIVELRLNLKGEITSETTLGELLAAAEPLPEGCRAGRIDAAGFGS